MLITLTVFHWIVAYVIGYLRYDPNDSESTNGSGFFWIPIIGWMFIWLIAAYSVIAYLESPSFKARFYRKKGSK